MYTSYIGKEFLKLYNERERTSLSAKEFFDRIFFNLFFNDEKHLMHVGNSPFFQKPRDIDVETHKSKAMAQYANLKAAIGEGIPNMSVFVGYAAKDIEGTTSGQTSNIDISVEEDEFYASWIGEALAIGVSGGYVMLINEPEILWALFEGWKFYRIYLDQTPNVKDKQIETWNGHWICHWSKRYYNENEPDTGLFIEPSEALGNIAIPTRGWLEVLFSLSQKFPHKVLMAYAYNLSQTNTTLGFINIYLPEIHKPYELRDTLFHGEKQSVLSDLDIMSMASFYTFKTACQLGSIGLKAIEPAQLRRYMPIGSVSYAQGKEFQFSKNESYINYKLYKIWIIAMINKTELLDLATNVAFALIEFEKTTEKGKTIFSNMVKETKDSCNIKSFISNLTEIMEKSPVHADTFRATITEVLKMPADNFPLFITLIRFEYAYLKSKN